MTRPAVIAVVGATATGKTSVAEALAAAIGAEIVCADSRQVFAELEIGTGRPAPAERARLPHHLFEALHLGQHASAGWYARAAGETCEAIRSRGRLPLLVGGSGLYLRALREGLAATPPHDPVIRERLRAEMETDGPETLHRRLAAVDPDSAARLAPRDRQRIGRALEVYESTGRTLTWWHERPRAAAAGDAWVVFELTATPDVLRARIARRTSAMLEEGLIEETRALLHAGHGAALRALRAIGYDEAMALLEGATDRAAAEARINQRTAQLAKRQRTWFRHQIAAIRLDTEAHSRDALVAAMRETLR
jgi:tRNA dimethylallyltransferase